MKRARRGVFSKVGKGRRGECIGTCYIKFTDGQTSRHYRLKEYDNGCDIREEYRPINRQTFEGAVKAGKENKVINVNKEIVVWWIRHEFEKSQSAAK